MFGSEEPWKQPRLSLRISFQSHQSRCGISYNFVVGSRALRRFDGDLSGGAYAVQTVI